MGIEFNRPLGVLDLIITTSAPMLATEQIPNNRDSQRGFVLIQLNFFTICFSSIDLSDMFRKTSLDIFGSRLF